MTVPTLGVVAISKEREEQIYKHGRSIEYDREFNKDGQLADAAAVLALQVPLGFEGAYLQNVPPLNWDKDIWLDMLKKPYKERVVIAGALMAAEYDRIS